MTIEERIQELKKQQEQAKEIFIKCVGAIEVLEQMLSEGNATPDDKSTDI